MERDFEPKQIFVTEKAAQTNVTAEIIEQYPQAKVAQVKSVREVRSPKRGLKEAIAWGKRTLVISHSRKFVEQFHDDEFDMICPTFRKLTPATHCPFDCQFCFLQSTYRTLRPWVCVYTDLFKMLFQLDMAVLTQYIISGHQTASPLVFNAGEMCDSLATLRIVPGLLRELVEYFAKIEDAKLLLLTRSAKVDELLDLAHNGNTIVTWSLNCTRVISAMELGTASLEQRLAAARAGQEAGYPIRFRFEPLIYVSDWKQEYAAMVEQALKTVAPERITLGSLRLLPNLRRIIEARFPNSELLDQKLEQATGSTWWRYPHEVRRQMYEFVIGQIRQYNPTVCIGTCKETRRMWFDLQEYLTPLTCNCLP